MLETTVIGSYPQPRWLVDPERLLRQGVARVRAGDLWKVDDEDLAEALEAATLVAIADQEEAGVDIITDGEVGRESYFNHFANSLGGVDRDRVGQGRNRIGGTSPVPLVTSAIVRTQPVELDAAKFLRAHTRQRTKVTVPGPFTLSQLAQNEHYRDQRSLAMAYAAAINEELLDLAAAGIDVLQVDEPYLQANAKVACEFAVEAISAAIRDIPAIVTVHTCYGYAAYVTDKRAGYPFFDELAALPADYVAIEAAQPGLSPDVIERLSPRGVVFGVIDLARESVESVDEVAAKVEGALRHAPAERLMFSPDCGMKYLPRERARAKLRALVDGVALVRGER